MTLRSRKKPPTTPAKVTEANFPCQPLRFEPLHSTECQQTRFGTAAAAGLIAALLVFFLAVPLQGQDETVSGQSTWSPRRDSKPTQASPLRAFTDTKPANWARPARLNDTSSHLGWRSPQSPRSQANQNTTRAKQPAAAQRIRRAATTQGQAEEQGKIKLATYQQAQSTPQPRSLEMPRINPAGKAAPETSNASPSGAATMKTAATKTAVANLIPAQQVQPAQSRVATQTHRPSLKGLPRHPQHRVPTGFDAPQDLLMRSIPQPPNELQRSTAKTGHAAAPSKLVAPEQSSTRTAQRSAKRSSLAQPKPLRQIQLVQNVSDLDILFADEPSNSKAPAAPSPEDVFDLTQPRQPQDTRGMFKDQSPPVESRTGPEGMPSPATTNVQFDSRFGAQPPTAADRPAVAETMPEPLIEPRPFQVEDLQFDGLGSDARVPSVDDANDRPSPSDNNRKSEIQSLTDELDKLPPVPGETGDSETDRSDDNPLKLGGVDDDNKRSAEKLGELAGTNGRDCLAAGEACQTDFTYLKRRERTGMSLDITPSIEPREYDMAKVEQVRYDKLAKAPSRPWKDHDGNVIADGSLEDFRDGRVFVRTVNGTIRTIEPHRLSNADWCFVTSYWEIPAECRFETEQYAMRDFRLTTFTWKAAATCHKPLYFEQVGVERYGHSMGPIVQPIVSGAHFFGDVVMLPYHVGLNPPDECVYSLGHYRPGDCAPWLMPGFPFSSRAFKWEGLAWAAAIALLP